MFSLAGAQGKKFLWFTLMNILGAFHIDVRKGYQSKDREDCFEILTRKIFLKFSVL